ncbi:unnamed protein product [Sympodiomycopsis kandeliae]
MRDYSGAALEHQHELAGLQCWQLVPVNLRPSTSVQTRFGAERCSLETERRHTTLHSPSDSHKRSGGRDCKGRSGLAFKTFS